ncbi:MAG: AAA family ATPase [Gammaproteobacteria bacterium]|nr:AAA family ATPase [Gammaproteobacteria bacterium]MDE2345539.1 AAA family ATPase [Gammaproteobacteria bacterium]
MKSSSRQARPAADQVAMSDSQKLIHSLSSAGCYPHPAFSIRILETHASWVVLTGEYAYKIKKPVDLGFLDYSSLEKRRHACYEELRLNVLLAPELYIGVVPITGTPSAPCLQGQGRVIEYAVQMREFDQARRLDHLLEQGRLGPADMDDASAHVAAFHLAAPIMESAGPYGRGQDVHKPVMENFSTLTALLGPGKAGEIGALRKWSDAEYHKRRQDMQRRRNLGWVRECHGDLHLANLVKYRGRILAFDRIEFSETLRWIDVMNDAAFLVMDLLYHGHADLAFRFLNTYLQDTGDYRGLVMLRYYLVYRALVRAKVALLQNRPAASASRDADAHIDLANGLIQSGQPRLILMHGLSGSGKTWLSQQLLMALPAVRIRSDVERKRIHGQIIAQGGGNQPESGLYTQAASQRTYREMAELAACVCGAGWNLIMDAAFLQQWQRHEFHELAERLGIPWVIVDCRAPETVLRARLEQRAVRGSDVSDADQAVLEYQLKHAQPLDENERQYSVAVDTLSPPDIASLLSQLRCAQQGAGSASS